VLQRSTGVLDFENIYRLPVPNPPTIRVDQSKIGLCCCFCIDVP
jgi:hypothetical protein